MSVRSWRLACLGLVPLMLLLVATGAAEAGRLFVFGDSYSAPNRRPFPNWAEQLLANGAIDELRDYAVSGATASSSSGKTFFRQISRWRQDTPRFADGDTTVIYFGYNDIDQFTSFTGSRSGYRSGLQALIDAGANAVGRRLILVVPHDWGSIPRHVSNAPLRDQFRSKTITWNKFVRGLSDFAGKMVIIDVFRLIENVRRNPARFGFDNVTRADPARSATTALYDDDGHFGAHGQALIRSVIEPHLQPTATPSS